MKFGLTPSDFKTFDDIVVRPLKEAGFRIYVFGSRATGKHTAFSDIDLLLEAPDPVDSSLLSTIKEEIEEARFPIKVDFVLTQNLAKSYSDLVHRDKIEIH